MISKIILSIGSAFLLMTSVIVGSFFAEDVTMKPKSAKISQEVIDTSKYIRETLDMIKEDENLQEDIERIIEFEIKKPPVSQKEAAELSQKPKFGIRGKLKKMAKSAHNQLVDYRMKTMGMDNEMKKTGTAGLDIDISDLRKIREVKERQIQAELQKELAEAEALVEHAEPSELDVTSESLDDLGREVNNLLQASNEGSGSSENKVESSAVTASEESGSAGLYGVSEIGGWNAVAGSSGNVSTGGAEKSDYWEKISSGGTGIEGAGSWSVDEVKTTKVNPILDFFVKDETEKEAEDASQAADRMRTGNAEPEPAESTAKIENVKLPPEMSPRLKRRMMQFQRRLNMKLQKSKASRSFKK